MTIGHWSRPFSRKLIKANSQRWMSFPVPVSISLQWVLRIDLVRVLSGIQVANYVISDAFDGLIYFGRTGSLNPYWQILGKFMQYFFRNLSFSGGDYRFLENSLWLSWVPCFEKWTGWVFLKSALFMPRTHSVVWTEQLLHHWS